MSVPPEADGYNAQYLKSSSGGGKITMFIVPLQEDLDIQFYITVVNSIGNTLQ